MLLRFRSSRREYKSVAIETTSETRIVNRYVSTSAPRKVVWKVRAGLYVHVCHASANHSPEPVAIVVMRIVVKMTFQSVLDNTEFLGETYNRIAKYRSSAKPVKMSTVAIYEYIPKFMVVLGTQIFFLVAEQ